MTRSFPYPLPPEALAEFCHPAEWHAFHRPRWHAGEVLAGNGYLVIRASRGRWLESDFLPASAEFLGRVGKLPWGRWDEIVKRDTWRALEDERGRIFARKRIGVWADKGGIGASPVWMVGEIPVRLSALQLVAMLPRCEVFTGPVGPEDPLWFRFSGGIGAIARDRKLTPGFSAALFVPRVDTLDGTLIHSRPTRTAPHRYTLPGWPPPEPADP